MDERGYENIMQVPHIEKVTINMGVGEAIGDKKVIENALADMEKISGQKPVTTLARKSVASFKVRDGYPIGCKVTLRKDRMYEFLDSTAPDFNEYIDKHRCIADLLEQVREHLLYPRINAMYFTDDKGPATLPLRSAMSYYILQ